MVLTSYIVDLQGFKLTNNRFVFKEVALLNCTNAQKPTLASYVFAPPFPLHHQSLEEKKQTNWIENNLHLNWEESGTSYTKLSNILHVNLSEANIVYVKGSEKMEWIRHYVPPNCQLVNLEDFGCPALHKLLSNTKTIKDRKSVLHVWKLFDWLTENACDLVGRIILNLSVFNEMLTVR